MEYVCYVQNKRGEVLSRTTMRPVARHRYVARVWIPDDAALVVFWQEGEKEIGSMRLRFEDCQQAKKFTLSIPPVTVTQEAALPLTEEDDVA